MNRHFVGLYLVAFGAAMYVLTLLALVFMLLQSLATGRDFGDMW